MQERPSKKMRIIAMVKKYSLSYREAYELVNLISEITPLGFTHSSQLSNHIKDHQLGYKYPNISGIVTMQREDREWDFKGGFPKNIYRILCKELNLDGRNSDARAVGFISYSDMENSNQVIIDF